MSVIYVHFLDHVLSGLFKKTCSVLIKVLAVLLSTFDSAVAGSAHPCCSQPHSGFPCLGCPCGESHSLVKLVSAFFSTKNRRPLLVQHYHCSEDPSCPSKQEALLVQATTGSSLTCCVSLFMLHSWMSWSSARCSCPLQRSWTRWFPRCRLLPVLFLFLILNASLKLNVILWTNLLILIDTEQLGSWQD